MDMEEKNRISHRSKALEKMKEILVPYLKKGEHIDIEWYQFNQDWTWPILKYIDPG